MQLHRNKGSALCWWQSWDFCLTQLFKSSCRPIAKVDNGFHWWVTGLDFHIFGFHYLQLHNFTHLDLVEFLFLWFIQILLDSSSVLYDCYSFQENSKFAWYSWPYLIFLPLVAMTSTSDQFTRSNLFVNFCTLQELTGIFHVKLGGTSLKSRHLYGNLRWSVVCANSCFNHSLSIDIMYRVHTNRILVVWRESICPYRIKLK